MIKIVHLITGLNIGGAEMMLYKLVSGMDRKHFQNTVVSMTDSGTLGEKIKALGVPVHTLNMKRGVPNPLGFWRFFKLLLAERPQILQTWLYHADLLGSLAGWLARIPYIIWNVRASVFRREDHSKLFFLTLKLLAKLSKMPKAVIVNSSAGRAAHEQLGYRPVRWEIIPNGFNIDIFHPSKDARLKLRHDLGLFEQTFLIGLVARFDPMKDHMNFLKAVNRICEIRTDVHFIMVGQGVTHDNFILMKQIAALGIDKYVHLLGERDDIPDITAALDTATVSSYSEGFPNVVGEAMSCGVPCVVTNVGDSAYIVGDTGIVVPPSNPEAMAEAWNGLLSMSKDEYDLLSRAARERIASSFSIDTITKQYEGLYADVLEDS